MKKYLLIYWCFITMFSISCIAQDKHINGSPLSVVADNDTCRLIDSYLEKLTKEKGFSGGLLIIKDGKKIFSKGYGYADKVKNIPFTTSTLASMGSITKAFTATAIMKLAEQGKLATSDKLKKYFPKIPSDKEDITIHQLLTHSSGFSEFLKDDQGDYQVINTEEYLKKAFEEPLVFKPGSKAIYTNVGMSILAIIIEKVTGLDYEKFLKQELFQPIGIYHIGYQYPQDSNVSIAHGYKSGNDWGTHQSHFENAGGGPFWNLKGNGGLEASLDEMYLWANAFTFRKILNDTSIEKMFTPHIVEENTNNHYYFGYGCNISKSRRNTTVIDNGGSNRIYYARLLRLPQENLVIYMVTNEQSTPAEKVLPNITQLYFTGKITQDAFEREAEFENPIVEKIYKLVIQKGASDFENNLASEKIMITDDMVLLEAGQKLSHENKIDEAIAVYEYYTLKFPNIIIAYNDLGDLYQQKGNREKAINCYKQALKLRPGNPRATEELTKLGVK